MATVRTLAKGATVPLAGIVLDKETGEPLIGAHVAQRIPGEAIGDATDVDGVYAFDARPGEFVEVSFVGYVKEVFTMPDEPSLDNVHLLERASFDLPEVEIFGEGPREESKTGSGWLLGLFGLALAAGAVAASRRRRRRNRIRR